MSDLELGKALRFGSAVEVRRVLQSGVDPNGSEVFHLSSEDFEEKLDTLLEHGWDIGNCQLLHDAKHGFGKRVEAYLTRGADANKVDGSGQNALHKFAALGIGRSAIRALVRAGANPRLEDRDGDTPLDLAQRAKRKVAADTLREILTTES